MNKPRLLLYDIESSHNLVLSFGIYEQDIPHENILIDRHIFCISYRWYGDNKTHTISVLDDKKRFKKNIHDDFYVLEQFSKVVAEADGLCGHYSSRFDLPMINARLVVNKLPPLPKVIQFDTKDLASKYFNFNCNKLDYLAKLLGHKGKLENPKDLWIKCFQGDVRALKHLIKYNRADIDALYFVFEKLIPFMKNYPLNSGMFLKGARCSNPTCGSTNIEWRGWNYTRVSRYRRFLCRDCHSWSDERKAFIGDKCEIK